MRRWRAFSLLAVALLNVPIGAVALMLARRVVPKSRLRSARRSYDVLGAVTVTGALVMLVYAISQAPAAGWTAIRTLALLTAAAALLAGFCGCGDSGRGAATAAAPVPAADPG